MTAGVVAARPREVLLDVMPALIPSGGIGRYVQDLVEAFETRPDAPPCGFAYPRGFGDPRAHGWSPSRLRPLRWGSRGQRALTVLSHRLQLGADRLYGEPAVVHLPSGYGPRFTRARLLVTIHDLTGLTRPEWHPLRTRLLVEQSLPGSVRAAHHVCCDSEFVRGQVLSTFGLAAERVETVPLAVNPRLAPLPAAAARERLLRRFGLNEPFVLHVGTFEPRKNHAGLAQAFESLRRAGFPGRLVMVGRDGWHVAPIHAALEASPERPAHVVVRDADDADLAALYSACELFAFPSFEEGFGLPPLEALACGAPVVCSDRTSLPEVVGGAAILVDPADAGGLSAAIVELWRNAARRAELRAAGPARARRFGMETFVKRMFAIYARMLAEAG